MKVPKHSKKLMCRKCNRSTKINMYKTDKCLYLECDSCKNATRLRKR